jgi:hypothetical protein
MKYINKTLLTFFSFLISFSTSAQEILATVSIDAELIQNMEKQIFMDMKQNITQFINTRKWTNDKFSPIEQIKVNFGIKLMSMPSTSKFKATAQIQASRPVYGVGYETITLNFLDKDFNFDYTPSQPLDFNEATYFNNLSSLIGFYVYFILGIDYDTFSKAGGNAYFEKALLALNNAQSGGEAGWRQFDDNPNNRYWLMENMGSPQFREFREGLYVYHRQGLDVMVSKPEEGRAKIIETLVMLKKIFDVRPSSCLLRTYFNTKDLELINVLQDATSAEKSKAVELLKLMDPTNSDKYDKLLK